MEPMDLSEYSLEDVFLTAIKSEVESKELYSMIAARVKNAFLKDRMAFLAGEEERHRTAMTKMFKTYFPGKAPKLPAKSPVPLPEISFDEANPPPLVKVFGQAMKAEQAAQAFYLGLAEKVGKDRQVADTLVYFAAMEGNHYRILESERSNAQKYDDYDDYNPMMHSGP